MIATPTVLVLGAGASVHCHYPLGRQLVCDLCELRERFDQPLPPQWGQEIVRRFLRKLSYSDPSSIDAFLERHPQDGALGKYLIAQQLKKNEKIDALFPPNDAGWYRYVFGQLLVNGEPRFKENALTVVTFNYDRSLEAYLYVRLQAEYNLDEEAALEILNQLSIIHVHGILGDFPSYPYQPDTNVTELLAISEKIQIIHELGDHAGEYCNDQFKRAHDKLNEASRNLFSWFRFSPR
jgi:hypothetical protein